MGSEDRFKRSKVQNSHRRKAFLREPRERILIVCEGERTEPQYFKAFQLTNVKIVGTGYNTDSLVNYSLELQNEAIKNKEKFDQVWCVFDRDSFPSQNYNNAFIIAAQNGISIAYSNEAFELWYLLHHHYYDSALSRTDYISKLDGLFGYRYQKNSPNIYEDLKSKQHIAIRNAEKLLLHHTADNPERNNPSTTVHLLVNELNKWLKE